MPDPICNCNAPDGGQHTDECPVSAASVEVSATVVVEDAEAVVTGATLIQTEGHVWAVRQETLATLEDLHGRVVTFDFAAIEAASGRKANKSGPTPTVASGGVAVIDLQGIITPKMSFMSLLMGGGYGLDYFRAELRAAAADPEVNSIVLNVDSPGGVTDQVQETAAFIRQVGELKPIVACANCQAGSAAYWLASQAHELVVTPSGEVGSIGAYQIHRDMSQALEGAGIKMSIIRAGRFKAENNPYEGMTDEGRQHAQQSVNDFYNAFVKDVALGRGATPEAVADGYGEGRMLTAKRAVSAGLADRVATLEETVRRLGSGRARVRRMAAAEGGRLVLEIEDDVTLEDPEAKKLAEENEDKDTAGGSSDDQSPDYTAEDKDRLLATLAGLG